MKNDVMVALLAYIITTRGNIGQAMLHCCAEQFAAPGLGIEVCLPAEHAARAGAAVGGRVRRRVAGERLVQVIFVRGDVTKSLDRMKNYTDAVAAAGLADVHLVAPFFRTVVGTDTYVNELW